MTRANIHRMDDPDEGYRLQAVIYDDGTVDGDTADAEHFRNIIQNIEDRGYIASDIFPEMFDVVDARYNTGQYRTVIIDG